MSNIESYTQNFKFKIPDFNVATWHDEIKYNFVTIDALIANFVNSVGYKGEWKKVTYYAVGDTIYISDENSEYFGEMFRVIQAHTTTNKSFDEFLQEHSGYYELFSIKAAYDAAQLAQDWASKTDGIVRYLRQNLDYSAKAYAIGGVGTETNNAKYFKEQSATYATNSQNSATAAEISRTNARSAADTAISARIAAISAKNSAETAATTATQQASNAAQSAQQAAQSAASIVPSRIAYKDTDNTYTGNNLYKTDLRVNKSLPHVFLDGTVPWSTDPSTNSGRGSFEVRDSDGTWGAIFGTEQYTDGRRCIKLQLKGKDMTSTTALRIFINADGTDYLELGSGSKTSINTWGMPNYSATVSVSVSGLTSISYTAPSNGQFTLNYAGGTSQHITSIKVNNISLPISGIPAGGEYYDTLTLNLKKGDVVTATASGSNIFKTCVFVPCIGG